MLVGHHGVGIRLDDTLNRLPHNTEVYPIGRGIERLVIIER